MRTDTGSQGPGVSFSYQPQQQSNITSLLWTGPEWIVSTYHIIVIKLGEAVVTLRACRSDIVRPGNMRTSNLK